MITGLLLAGGAGRRAGGPKALRHDHGGGWLRRSVDVLRNGGCGRVVVVVGASADAAAALVADVPQVSTVVAADWAHGMSASLRRGLRHLTDHDQGDGSTCVHLVDLPDVTAAVISRVLDHDHGPTTLARAAYVGRPGHPVLLGRDHLLPMAAGLGGDAGGRGYLATRDVIMVECGDLAGGRDVDGDPKTLTEKGSQRA